MCDGPESPFLARMARDEGGAEDLRQDSVAAAAGAGLFVLTRLEVVDGVVLATVSLTVAADARLEVDVAATLPSLRGTGRAAVRAARPQLEDPARALFDHRALEPAPWSHHGPCLCPHCTSVPPLGLCLPARYRPLSRAAIVRQRNTAEQERVKDLSSAIPRRYPRSYPQIDGWSHPNVGPYPQRIPTYPHAVHKSRAGLYTDTWYTPTQHRPLLVSRRISPRPTASMLWSGAWMVADPRQTSRGGERGRQCGGDASRVTSGHPGARLSGRTRTTNGTL